jgi:hypothetical protein
VVLSEDIVVRVDRSDIPVNNHRIEVEVGQTADRSQLVFVPAAPDSTRRAARYPLRVWIRIRNAEIERIHKAVIIGIVDLMWPDFPTAGGPENVRTDECPDSPRCLFFGNSLTPAVCALACGTNESATAAISNQRPCKVEQRRMRLQNSPTLRSPSMPVPVVRNGI